MQSSNRRSGRSRLSIWVMKFVRQVVRVPHPEVDGLQPEAHSARAFTATSGSRYRRASPNISKSTRSRMAC